MSTNNPIAKKLQSLRWRFSVLLFFSAFTVHAQYVWSSEDYSKWTYDTFRQHPHFHDKFSPTDPDYLLLNAAVFYLTNEQRVKYGVYPLPYHKSLETAAYNHSLKMATRNFFSHSNNLDNSRKSTSDRAMLAGISNPYLAENIAYHYVSANDSYIDIATKLIDQWINSPGHRSNILSTKGKQMGAGTYYHDGRIYGTQNFQWYENIRLSSSLIRDQLPSPKRNSTGDGITIFTTQGTNTGSKKDIGKPSTNELQSLKDEIARLNKTISDKNRIIAEFKNTKPKSTSAKGTIIKVGFYASYPAGLNNISAGFDERQIGPGGELMIGSNEFNSNKENITGLSIRASQLTPYSTMLADSTLSGPLQKINIELTSITKKWLVLSAGASYRSAFESKDFTMNPSASIGLCIGPETWKIQIFQYLDIYSSLKISSSSSIGFSLQL